MFDLFTTLVIQRFFFKLTERKDWYFSFLLYFQRVIIPFPLSATSDFHDNYKLHWTLKYLQVDAEVFFHPINGESKPQSVLVHTDQK